MGADNKTLKAIQTELLAIYKRNYKGVKAASAEAEAAEASSATNSRVQAGKVKATPDDERVVDVLENIINSEGFIQDDVPMVGR